MISREPTIERLAVARGVLLEPFDLTDDCLARTLRTIATADTAVVGGTGAAPLHIDQLWTVDTATGLVMEERRQSWIVEPDGAARTLVEERVRAVEPAS